LARGAPRNFGFIFNISATVEAMDFKFGTQLGFAKAHYKITRREKSGGGLRLGELCKILDSPIIFLQWLGLATSNLARSWRLPRPILKSHAEERVGASIAPSWAMEAPKYLGFPFNISATAALSSYR